MRFYPALGDPFQLTIPQFNGLLDRISDLAEMESGKVDHRAHVERMRRRQREES